ncbi:MAG: hypothetical protein EA398_07405 [Deltaproteobacteria bacterium]|nr:MAG: hypothetical protein EA398_07405 [Deltaproteobacteria bacterium]
MRSNMSPHPAAIRLALGVISLALAMLATGSLSAHAAERVTAPALPHVVETWLDGTCAPSPQVAVRPVEATIAWLYAARCAFDTGRFEEAIAALERAAELGAIPGSSLHAHLPWYAELEARRLLHAGDPDAAVLAWQELLEDPRAPRTSSATRARRMHFLALALERAGRDDDARDVQRSLLHEHPGDPLTARIHILHLDDAPHTAQLIERADAARRGRHYPTAERLLRAAACGAQSECSPDRIVPDAGPDVLEAAWRLGHLLQRYRREHAERGLPWLRAVATREGPRQQDADHTLGLALLRAGRTAEALLHWQQFPERWPDAHARRQDAIRHVAMIHLQLRDDEAAIPVLESLRQPGRPGDADWWIGWALFRLDRCPEARAAWEPLASSGRPREIARIHYWTAVCLEQEGHTEDASARWTTVDTIAPLSWYAFLARRRLGLDPIPQPDGGAPRQRAVRTRLDLAERLAELGLHDEAALVDRVERRRTDRERRLRVHASREDWIRARRTAGRRLDRPPANLRDLRQWQGAYPPLHGAAVRRFATEWDVPPDIILAVMEQESSFRRHVVSVSDAMGLMQVIPQTAEAIARLNTWTYTDGQLFEPLHAIRYGSWYLGALYRQFDDSWPIAVAAYNAGPIAMWTWIERHGDQPLDRFVEEMAFEQARNYARSVITLAVRYRLAADPHGAWTRDPELGGLLPSFVRREHTAFPDF